MLSLQTRAGETSELQESKVGDRVGSLRVVESKRGFRLVYGDLARDFRDIAIESASEEVVVAEYESLFKVESAGDDITCVAERIVVRLLRLQLMLEQELLVV